MPILENLRKERTTIGLFFVTILIIPFQLLFLSFALLETDISGVQFQPQFFFPHEMQYAVLLA